MDALSAAELLDADYVVFGNRRRGVLLPLSSRVGARAGIGMLGASRRAAVAAEALVMAATTIAGPRVLRGTPRRLGDAVDREVFGALWEQVEACIGAVDALAVLERPQSTRPGMGVLAVIDRRVAAYVRLQPARHAPVSEHDVLRAVAGFAPRSFSAPAPLGAGVAGDWEWIATAPMRSRLHRADWTSDPHVLAGEISAALGTVLGPPPRPGWVAIHGDLAPWNLRRSRRRTVLFDWESVDHGPPGADAAYLEATRATVRGREPRGHSTRNPPGSGPNGSALRPASGLDRTLNDRLALIFRTFAA